MRRSEGRGNPVSAVLAQSSAPGGSRAPPGGRQVEDGVRAGASHTARPTAAPHWPPTPAPHASFPGLHWTGDSWPCSFLRSFFDNQYDQRLSVFGAVLITLTSDGCFTGNRC